MKPATLYDQLAQAIQREKPLDWHSSMIHSNAKIHLWTEVRETCVLLERGAEQFHLQLRLEQNDENDAERVVIFGRRESPRNRAPRNTPRATFNSGNFLPEGGYFIRPRISKKGKTSQARAFARLLPSGELPFWDGTQFVLGDAAADVLLHRFLRVLKVVESIKSRPIEEIAAEFPESQSILFSDLPFIAGFQEGQRKQLSTFIRKRCDPLRKQIRAYYEMRSPDGRLRCLACDWAPPLPVRGEIVQIHHSPGLASYPEQGKTLSWAQALEVLHPLCPNCHRMIEAKPAGGHYSLGELRELIRNPSE